jgi:hypothetical protein
MNVEAVLQKQWEQLKTQMDEIQGELWKLRSTFKIHSIAVNDLGQNEWRLDKPLIVAVEQRGEEDFIACFYDADVYGYGDSIPEALDDLKERLINQLEFLLEEEKRVILGPAPQKQLEVLRHHIKKGAQQHAYA